MRLWHGFGPGQGTGTRRTGFYEQDTDCFGRCLYARYGASVADRHAHRGALCGRDVVRGVRPAGLRRPLFYVVSWLQSEQAVLSLLECGVDQYMAFPLSLQRLRGKVSNDLNRLL